jgi:hypothetical protein
LEGFVKRSFVASLILLLSIATTRVAAQCLINPPRVGGGTGGCALFSGGGNLSFRVAGNPSSIVFVGVGGGGAGGSAGGSGFAGNERNDNGGGGGGGAGAPILGYQVATATGDVFQVVIGSGGRGPTSGGSMGTPGTAGGDGSSSEVRRVNGANLVFFPGGQGGRGGIGSTHQPAITPGGAPMPSGANGGNGGAESRAGDNGGLSFILTGSSCQAAIGGTTSADHGGGGGGGGSALCIGGNGGNGGSSQGSAGGHGSDGQFGAGGGGAGARGAGGEIGAGGGNGGDGLVIVLWGSQARDFPIATDGLVMSDAGVQRVRAALRDTCICIGG